MRLCAAVFLLKRLRVDQIDIIESFNAYARELFQDNDVLPSLNQVWLTSMTGSLSLSNLSKTHNLYNVNGGS